MAYKVTEVNEIPEATGTFADVVPDLLDQAMDSKTGVIAVKFDTLDECHSRVSTIVSWVKRHKLNDVFIIRQRKGTCFIKEVRSKERHGLK